MDLTDKSILGALDDDCRLSYQKIALALDITANAVKKRVAKLIGSGVISQFTVQFKPAMIDAEVLIAMVHTDGTESSDEFIAMVGAHRLVLQVSYVASTSGGAYMVFAEYIGTPGLAEIGSFLRSRETIDSVEMFPLLFPRGNKIEVSNLDLRVLKYLVDDPRMSISDLAAATGLTARRVRKILYNLQESDAYDFTIRWNITTGGTTEVHFKISWDENKATIQDVVDWLRENYKIQFWYPFISAIEPIVMATFAVESLQKAETILREICSVDFITSASTIVCYSNNKFPWLGEVILRERIAEKGF